VANRAAWIVLALAVMFTAYVRVRLAEFPLERDEGEYAYAGQLILQGIPPYTLAYNMKLPGTYLAYAGLMAVFGQSTAGVHLGLLAVNIATIFLVFFLTRELFDSMAGAMAAAAYAVLSTSSTVLGQAAHATHFVALFGTAGAWVLWRAMRGDKAWLFAAAGILLGLAFLMKQQGVFLLVFGGLATLVYCLQQRPILSLRNLAACVGVVVGGVLPFIGVCLWLWQAGAFDRFWFWTVDYARTYVGQVPASAAFDMFCMNTPGVVGANWPLWVLTAFGAYRVARASDVPGRRWLVFLFLAMSFLCVCPGFYFRQHYYIVLLPCVAMLSGVGAASLMRAIFKLTDKIFRPASPPLDNQRARNRKRVADEQGAAQSNLGRGLAAFAAALVPTLALAMPAYSQRGYYFLWSPETACRRIYGANPFLECPVIADYIRDHSGPNARVAVLGSEPEVYFLARRISATGYIYTYALMESHPFARTMQEEMIREIEASEPEYLVVVNVATSWLVRPNSDMHLMEWMQRYATSYYRPVGLIDIVSDTETDYRWDADAQNARPRSNCHLWVFRRKP